MSIKAADPQLEIDDGFFQAVIPVKLKEDFERWLEIQGLYLSSPVIFTNDETGEEEDDFPTRFVWPKRLQESVRADRQT